MNWRGSTLHQSPSKKERARSRPLAMLRAAPFHFISSTERQKERGSK
jgi:hypothetical protein